MKKLSLILSVVLSLSMLFSLGAFASGEPSEDASGEASGQAASVEEAYLDYAREFLQAELLVNSYMTQEQIDNEFMPLVEAHDYETFPAYNMYHDGWFVNGPAMTFEEFAAQYQPDASSVEEAYLEYIRDFLQAELLVNDYMTQEQIDNEYMPLIEAGNYTDFPASHLFNEGWLVNGTAMTYEEFAAQYQPAGSADPAGSAS